MLFFRGPNWDKGLSAEELQQVMGRVMSWFDSLKQQGRIKAGQPLGEERKIVSAKKGQPFADGPYAESKEAIGGYLVVQARDLDEAAAIAQTCPNLEYGVSIEVRPVLEECPTFQRAQKQLLTSVSA